MESSNDFNPIRNWANELHAKDTSRKVRAVMKMKAEQESGWAADRPTAIGKVMVTPTRWFRTRTPRLW